MSNPKVSGNIQQSVIVTGDGNRVSLQFGSDGPSLPLVRHQSSPPSTELDILNPKFGRLPLQGRETELKDLKAWLKADAAVSVHTLVGRAGTGKTRLAIELCESVDRGGADDGAWLAGFVRTADLAKVAQVQATAGFASERPTLLVLDYASAGHEALGCWLDSLAETPPATKLRLLLLEREAPEDFGWWRELTGSALNSAAPRRGLFRDLRPRQLEDLASLETRRAVMAAALGKARSLRGDASATSLPAHGDDPDFDAALGSPHLGNPLSLVMAGLIAAERGAKAALALRRLDAARHLARRELDRFTKLASPDGDAMSHLVAFNGLLGGIPLADIGDLVSEELKAAHLQGKPRRLSNLLQQELLPLAAPDAEDSRLGTVQPDLIGEGVIIEAFVKTSPAVRKTSEKIVQRAYARSADEAARALVRLLQDYAYALEDATASEEERETARSLMSWLTKLSATINDPVKLEPLAAALPMQTLILHEQALELAQRLADDARAAHDASGEATSGARAAKWFSNLAIRLSQLGKPEDALAAAEEAVAHYRALVATRSDAFTPALAGSLNSLAYILSDLGRREEALDAAEEAVTHYRALAEARPDAYTLAFATSLDTLASRQSDLGRREDALATAEEAIAHYRALAAARPDAFTPALANSLDNLAKTLSQFGGREDALVAAEEAVTHYRAFAEARPDAYTPDLATSLNNLAIMLSQLGRRKDALDAATEAVMHHRALAATRPDAFTPDLARSLDNLANTLSDLGRREDAFAAAEEAVTHNRAFAEARPDAFTPDLARSLNNLANTLSQLGRQEDALAAAEEAVTHYRSLAEARPDAFTPALAGTLNTLANTLSELDKSDEALAAAEEAVTHYRALAETRPDAFTPDLANLLNTLANKLNDLGRREAALAAAEEAVTLYRALAEARPDAFTPNLAGSLSNLANRLSDFGRREEALAAAEEAVAHYRALAEAQPDAFTPDLATSLNTQANTLSQFGRREEALVVVEEAVTLYRALAEARPDASRRNSPAASAIWQSCFVNSVVGGRPSTLPRKQ